MGKVFTALAKAAITAAALFFALSAALPQTFAAAPAATEYSFGLDMSAEGYAPAGGEICISFGISLPDTVNGLYSMDFRVSSPAEYTDYKQGSTVLTTAPGDWIIETAQNGELLTVLVYDNSISTPVKNGELVFSVIYTVKDTAKNGTQLDFFTTAVSATGTDLSLLIGKGAAVSVTVGDGTAAPPAETEPPQQTEPPLPAVTTAADMPGYTTAELTGTEAPVPPQTTAAPSVSTETAGSVFSGDNSRTYVIIAAAAAAAGLLVLILFRGKKK